MTTNFASSTRFDLSLIASSPMSANGTLKTLPKPPLLFRVWDGLISRFTKVAANVWFQTFTTLITIYALFGDDLKTAEFDKTTDGAFDILVFSATAIFAIEICINSLGRAGYFNSFYFWLDIVSTATLALDVSFISESVFGNADTVADEARGLGAHSGQGNGGSMLSKAGSKASRIVRIIRLIRLIRVVKIYKVWMQRKKDDGEVFFANDAGLADDPQSFKTSASSTAETMDPLTEEPQSKVGKKVTERITQKLVMVVLAMRIFLPFFSYDSETPSSVQYYVDLVNHDILAFVTECRHSSAASAQALRLKRVFEDRLLELVYTHNSSSLQDKLLFMGFVQVDVSDACSAVSNFEFSQVDLNLATSQSRFFSTSFYINTGSLSSETTAALQSEWSTTACSTDDTFGSGFVVNTKHLGSVQCPSDLRFDARELVFPFLRNAQDPLFFVLVDQRLTAEWEGRLSIFQTLFVIVVLAAGVFSFTADAETLVLLPIESTLQKMERIRANPVAATTLGEEDYRREVLERKKLAEWDARPRWQRFFLARPKGQLNSDMMMETAILEKTIIKIGSLLVLGFGEAGTGVIAQNMQGAEGGVNVLVPGKKVLALFGFITIRNFAEITEVLQDKVMLFVNQISEIVHGLVDEYGGATNKNVGHAFFVVWRLNVDDMKQSTRLCDLAVLSFIKITAAINRSPLLAEYRSHPGILQRIKDFRVELSFGLHVGQAIEGAVGSEFKIDASYVGPDVSLATRIQRLTVDYGCHILMTSAVIDKCSQSVRDVTRKVDNVAFDNNKTPVALFTVDLDPRALDLATPQPMRASRMAGRKLSLRRNTASTVAMNSQQSKALDALEVARAGMLRYKLKEERNLRKRIKLSRDYDVIGVFKTHRDICDMRGKFTDANGAKFNALFQKGILNYEAGEWLVAGGAL